MPSFILGPRSYRSFNYPPPRRGKVRVLVEGSFPIRVLAMSAEDRQRFIKGLPYGAYGTGIAYPNQKVDALVVLPYGQWHLILTNESDEQAAVYYEVFV